MNGGEGIEGLVLIKGERRKVKGERSTRKVISERGRALVAQRFTWPHTAQQMLSVYRWVLGRDERPDCVYLD
jgi:hypothetical protein